jgi:Squalene-hopene cyclase C-terminal domain/Prenyltransferase and squalene oxidase repeat
VRPLAATVLALTLLATSAAADADARNPVNQARLDSTIRYLQEAQNLDGGFGGDRGRESTQGISAWVALALAAGGIDPRCQARPSGTDAYGFLVDHFQRGLEEEIAWPAIPTTALERELMVVNTAGTDPHSFAGHDLVAEILSRVRDDGSFPYVPGGRGEINDAIFAIVSLAPVQEAKAQAAIQAAADWLIAQQNDDGGWAWSIKGRESEADLTGAAIQALRAAGRSDTEAEREGLAYLRGTQNPDGGFPEFAGETESNVASTAWAVQGIWAAGHNPETWVTGGNEPLSYLASLQQADGRLRWKQSADLNGVWMTAYAAPAFAGQTWPIPVSSTAAARRSSSSVCATSSAQAKPGQGEGTQSGKGVIAGGGSAGAPLFSRPKPQSKGKTPGGVRIVHAEPGARDHSRTRRGENATQSTVTVGAEPSRESDREPSAAGGSGAGPGGSSGSGGAGATVTLTQAGRAGTGHEVSGTLVGARPGSGQGAFGAPGLHSSGSDAGGASWVAAAIAAAALLCALAGSGMEFRRRVVLP